MEALLKNQIPKSGPSPVSPLLSRSPWFPTGGLARPATTSSPPAPMLLPHPSPLAPLRASSSSPAARLRFHLPFLCSPYPSPLLSSPSPRPRWPPPIRAHASGNPPTPTALTHSRLTCTTVTLTPRRTAPRFVLIPWAFRRRDRARRPPRRLRPRRASLGCGAALPRAAGHLLGGLRRAPCLPAGWLQRRAAASAGPAVRALGGRGGHREPHTAEAVGEAPRGRGWIDGEGRESGGDCQGHGGGRCCALEDCREARPQV